MPTTRDAEAKTIPIKDRSRTFLSIDNSLALTICTGRCTLTTELLMAYQIDITPAALEALEAVADRRTRSAIVRRIDAMAEEPKKLGKTLRGWLTGFLSLRTAGQRYRVIYKVDDGKKRIQVYLVGIRKEGNRRDVYALAERLVKRGLI